MWDIRESHVSQILTKSEFIHFHFYILFVVTAAGVVLCGSPKKQPRTSSIVQYIFFFLVLWDKWKYSEKSENFICLDLCILNMFSSFGPHLDWYQSFIGFFIETRNHSIISLAFIASSFRVTEENLVFETVQSGQ